MTRIFLDCPETLSLHGDLRAVCAPADCGAGGGSPAAALPCAARLSAPVRTKVGLTRFLPAQLTPGNSIYAPAWVAPIAWQGSGDMVSITRANCWLIVPPDRTELGAGEVVTVLLRSVTHGERSETVALR